MSLTSSSPRFTSLSAVFLGLVGLGLWSTPADAVGTRHFVLETARDFEGELQGVAVDSVGRLRPGLSLEPWAVSEAPAAWAALEHDGALLLATGNEGKLLRVQGGQTKVLADTETLALTSIQKAWGRIFVGSLPGGQLFELKGEKLEKFVVLEGEPHVFALAFDEKDQALYAATGPDGKLFRITRDGTAQVYFDSDQSHLVSVAAARGVVYAGSSGEARLYKITGPGRATVLRDFESTEVRGIAIGADDTVFAIANELKGGARSDSVNETKSPSPQKQSTAKGKGVLFSFSKEGEPEQLYTDKDDHFVTLSLDESGAPLVGTGGEGRLIRVGDDHESVVLADLDERQVAHVSLKGNRGWIVGSDPIVAHRVDGLGGKESLFTSRVLDAGLRARFGRISWDAEGRVEISTRTGNTKEPDATWSDYSPGLGAPAEVKSPAGRYFQVRVRMLEPGSSLRRLEVPFLTDNLRAVITEVKAESSGQSKGGTGLVKSGGPLNEKPSSTIKLSWKLDNPDEDELRFRVEYRPVSSTTWFDALEPGKVLTDEKFSWDTESLPEGKYRVRVTASDELSNPPERVTRHTVESHEILVDNTPPQIEGLTVRGRRVQGKAKDGVGPVRRIEARVAGTEEWVPFEPKDGIFDEKEEEFDLDLASLVPSGPALVTIRVFDSSGNSEVRHVRLEP